MLLLVLTQTLASTNITQSKPNKSKLRKKKTVCSYVVMSCLFSSKHIIQIKPGWCLKSTDSAICGAAGKVYWKNEGNILMQLTL